MSKKVGDADLYPAIRVDYLSNSNVFLSEEGEIESTSVVVSPELLFIADSGQLVLETEYRGRYSNSDFSADSYADHNLRLETKAELSKRIRAGARLQFFSDHHDLGTRYTRSSADENTDAVKYNNTRLHFFGNYGATQAKGNIELGLDLESLSFTNQAQLTEGDDYSSAEPYGIFSYRLSPDLRALAELRFGTSNYDDDSQDRSDVTALVGVSIAATGKLDGEIKIGSINSNYDSGVLQDQSELAVRTRLNYAPVDYSTLSLAVTRGIDRFSDNAAGANGAAIISDLVQLGWNHQWSSRFFSRASLARSSVNRECPSEDVISNSASFELNLRFRRWVEFGVGASNIVTEAKSCDGAVSSTENYSRTRVGVHMRATL